MAGQTIAISVLADTAPFAKAMKGVGIGVGAALAAVGAGVIALGAQAFKAVAEVERLNAQTAAAINSTAGAAGRSIEQVTGLADSLEKLSGVEAEVIQGAQNMLLTFTNVKGDQFDAASRAALDMSVAMGTDMTSAATLVGKALNDPIKGIGALSKVGVQLTDSQKAAIQSMVDMGDVAGAQGVILKELNTQFGGSAEAFGGTFLGTVEKVKNSFGSITESMVAGLLPGATAALGGLNALLLSVAASPAFAALVGGVNSFVTSLFSGESAVGVFIGQAVQLMASISPLGIVLQALAPLLPVLAGMFAQLAGVLGGAVVSILPTLTQLAGSLSQALGSVLAAVLPVIVSLVTTLAGVFAQLLPAVMPIVSILGGALATVITNLAPVFASIAGTLGGVLGTVLKALAPLLVMVATVFGEVLTAIMPLITAIMPLVGAVLMLIEPIAMLIGAILPPVIELFMALLKPILSLVAPLVSALTPAIQLVAGVLGGIVGVISGVITWFVQLISGSRSAADGFMAPFRAVGGFFASIIGNVVRLFENIPGTVTNLFAGAGRWLVDAGRNIIDGLINGARQLLPRIGEFFLNMVPSFIRDPFKAALGIRSPSRVFAGFGLNIVQGLANGVAQTATLDRAMSNLSATVTNGFAPTAALSAPTYTSSAIQTPTAAAAPGIVELSPRDRMLLQNIERAVGVTVNVGAEPVAAAASAGAARQGRRGAA